MSYNALCACVDLHINRVVLASSVNAIGLSELCVLVKLSTIWSGISTGSLTTVYSKRPKVDYLPLDENHPQRPEDAYSLSKSCVSFPNVTFLPSTPSAELSRLPAPKPLRSYQLIHGAFLPHVVASPCTQGLSFST